MPRRLIVAFVALFTVTAHGNAQTPAEAEQFVQRANRELQDLQVRANRAQWIQENFITEDTEALGAEVANELGVAIQRLAQGAKRFDKVTVSPDVRRQLTLLKISVVTQSVTAVAPPSDPKEAAELSSLIAANDGAYGRGKYCKSGEKGECLDINAIAKIMATSRNPAELLDVWKGWSAVGAPMRPRYERLVTLANKGARELGYADNGALWRSIYDMPPEQFDKEVDRLWKQLEPFYRSLHAYVRRKLNEQYGNAVAPPTGMIPAHLLGNIWAQDWQNIFPVVASKTAPNAGYDVTELLEKQHTKPTDLFRIAERFYTSLGMQPLPETFWTRSLLTKPRDRDVVCHASAWTMDNKEDLRIKMCAEVTGEDLLTVHHEEGHLYYDRAYNTQPLLYQTGANDGFHEAIGDAIALAVTPEYLKTIGLLDVVPSAAADTMLLLHKALEKVAFLPFGLLVDRWRWGVFSGAIKPSEYNKAWWDLRAKYQGVAPPVARSEADFDPGAKYHVAGNVPYARYFLAAVLQFQFYRAMCREAGWTGPLHRCTFYGNKAAGAKLERMLALGASKPWPDALFELTGSRELDAGAIAEYFAPLKAWLDHENKGVAIGW